MACLCTLFLGAARIGPMKTNDRQYTMRPNESIYSVWCWRGYARGGFVLPVLHRPVLGWLYPRWFRIVSFPLSFSFFIFFFPQTVPGGRLIPQHQQIPYGLHNSKPPRTTGATAPTTDGGYIQRRMADATRTHRATGIATPKTRRCETMDEIWLNMAIVAV